jgi:hypothetical protein
VEADDAILVELEDGDEAGAGSWRPVGAVGGDGTGGKRGLCEPPPWPAGELRSSRLYGLPASSTRATTMADG